MRKFLVALVLLFGIVFIIGRLSEVQTIIETLQHGDWRFLILALLIQLLWMLNVAASYRTIFQLLGLKEKLGTLFFVASAALFANIVAPTGGVSGMAVFIDHARKERYSSAKAATANALFILFDYAGFICILVLGIFVLFRRNNLNWAELAASFILLLLASGLAFLLYLGVRSAESLGQALARLARLVNHLVHPFIKRDYLSEERAYEFAHEAADGLKQIRKQPANLYLPGLLAISNKLLLLSVFTLIFLSFEVPFSTGTIVAGFSISYLFTIVSPTPSGIGIVEGMLALTLGSLNVPLGAAAVLAIAYRGITFWFPLLIGLISFRILSSVPRRETPTAEYLENPKV